MFPAGMLEIYLHIACIPNGIPSLQATRQTILAGDRHTRDERKGDEMNRKGCEEIELSFGIDTVRLYGTQ